MVPEAELRWTAKWIGPKDSPSPNAYFLARKRFTVDSPSDRALLRIAADARYAVTINEAFVGDGPARGTHRRYFADTYDVAALLRPGVNWIAVEVHACLELCYNMAALRPALLAEIEGLVATDDSWQVMLDPSHRPEAPTYTVQVGFSEWKDMATEPEGWRTGADGSDGWEAPTVLGAAEDFGGRVTVPRPIAPLTRDVLLPAGVVAVGGVPDAGGEARGPKYADLVAEEPHLEAPAERVEDANALTHEEGVTTVRPAEDGAGVFIVLDFGREVFGNFVIDIEAPEGALLDVAHDDALTDGRVNAHPTERYRFADRFALRDGRQTVAQRLHRRGFRYAQLVLRNFREPVRLHSVRLVNRIYPQEAVATFSCPDPFLNQLWETCVHTVRMCSSDTFMDCPWREQALWTNDQAVTNLLYLAMTGDAVFPAHNLRVGADGQRPNGLIPPVYPSEMERLFPSLPSLWTFSLDDYYRYTGDLEFLKELLPVMEKGLGAYDVWRDGDGLVPDQEGYWNFIDWAYTAGPTPVGLGGKTAPLNMLIASAYKRAAGLEREAGRPERAEEYATKSRQAVAALNAVLWDASRGLYRDCTAPITGGESSSQHPLAIGLYHDLFDEDQTRTALANLTRPDIIHAELYFQHYTLQALGWRGHADEGMAAMRANWRKNIEANEYTIWEMRVGRRGPNDCHSLCHAFACAPLYFMQSIVLGVRPVEPGFKRFTLAPHAVGLASASGSVPTPHGLVQVAWNARDDGTLALEAEVPQGTVAALPDGSVLEAGAHSEVVAGK